MKIPHISKTSMVAYFLFFVSFCIATTTAYFVFTLDVLKDWKLTIPEQPIHVGDTIVIESAYIKLRDVSGTATRYIVCDNAKGISIRYELNQRTANRRSGQGGTGIDVTIRRDIPDLPAKCKFAVAIEYEVLPFRKVHEYNETKEFMLQPERTTPVNASGEPQAVSQTNLVPVPASVSSSSSSSQNTPSQPQPQLESSQPTQPAPQQPQPSLVESVVTGVQGIVNSVLNIL